MSKQHDVFLSYSRKDKNIMEQVRDALRAQDIKVWTDEYLEPGTPVWERSIEQAIRDSRSLLVLLSPDSSESDWVRSELRMSGDRKLIIFPILIRGDEPTDVVPLGVYASQWIDARKKLDTNAIVSAVQKKLNIKGRTELEEEILELQIKVSEQEDLVKKLENELADLRKNSKDKATLEQETATLRNQLEQTSKEYEKEKTLLKTKSEELQKLVEEKLALESLLEELQTGKIELEEKLTNLEQQLATLSLNTSDKDVKLLSLTNQLELLEAEKKAQIEQLTKDLQTYQSRPTKAILEALTKERDDLQKEVHRLNSTFDQFKTQIQSLSAENNSMKAKISEISTKQVNEDTNPFKPRKFGNQIDGELSIVQILQAFIHLVYKHREIAFYSLLVIIYLVPLGGLVATNPLMMLAFMGLNILAFLVNKERNYILPILIFIILIWAGLLFPISTNLLAAITLAILNIIAAGLLIELDNENYARAFSLLIINLGWGTQAFWKVVYTEFTAFQIPFYEGRTISGILGILLFGVILFVLVFILMKLNQFLFSALTDTNEVGDELYEKILQGLVWFLSSVVLIIFVASFIYTSLNYYAL